MKQEQRDNIKKAVQAFLDNVDITKLKRRYKPRQKNPQQKFPFMLDKGKSKNDLRD